MINDNWLGIQGYSVRHHNFTGNFIYLNDYYGIRISASYDTPSEYNLFHHNIFINNLNDLPRWYSAEFQAYDTSINSRWYDEVTMEGNYWSEYNGSLPYYVIAGSYTLDLYPLNGTDSDGLLDGEEVHTYFTNPKNSDSDDDGLIDGAEVNIYFTDPADYDSDGDKLSDGAEVNTYNTDPLNADSDGDLMPDGWEVSHSLNPLVDDAEGDPDEDELSNLEEYEHGTNPNDPDTDGDTYYDGEEVRKGRDPLDPESHPLATDIRNQIIGGSVFGFVLIGGLTIYILIKKRIIKIKQ